MKFILKKFDEIDSSYTGVGKLQNLSVDVLSSSFLATHSSKVKHGFDRIKLTKLDRY